ncbi:SIMPL domain-containing protein [Patescibacteria group bacterium]|nr:SIMPL domain-containing protein [Patescibacteria group bacterium]
MAQEKNSVMNIVSVLLMIVLIFILGAGLVLFLVKDSVKVQLSGIPGKEEDRGITVSGTGTVEAVPDIASFTVTVNSEASTLEAARDDATNRMNRVISMLKDEGIDDEDLVTSSYDVKPKYKYDDSYNREIDGYTATQTLTVKVRDTEKAGELLTKTTESGATKVSSLSFTVDDREKLEDEARVKAIEDAKQRAEMMAGAVDQKVGAIISISEGSTPGGFNYSGVAAKETADAEAPPEPQIEPGEQEIVKTVSVRFEIL